MKLDYSKMAYELASRVAMEALSREKFEHTVRVVNYTCEICDRDCVSEEDYTLSVVLAYLHDVIEDSDVTFDTIEDTFGDYVARCVDRLTHRKDEKTYEEYIDEVLASSRPVQIVKRADMKDHLCQKETLTPKLKEKYLGVLDKFM